MQSEKAKHKNDNKADISPTQVLHARIMKIPNYILAGSIIFSGVIKVFSYADFSATVLAFIIFWGALIIYCVFYFASRLSAFMLIIPREVTQTTATLILCVVTSIIICIFFGFFPIFIPVAILFTIYSVGRKMLVKLR